MARPTPLPETEHRTIPDATLNQLLVSPGLEIQWEIIRVQDVVASVLEDLLGHSQRQQLAPDDKRRLIKLAKEVLAYDSESKGLFPRPYLPPPPLQTEWIRELRTWMADIGEDSGRGRPEQTWEPHLFAVGLGLFRIIYRKLPTATGGEEQRRGSALAFMMELIACGQAMAEERGLNRHPWRVREESAVKKQIRKRLVFEKEREPWRPRRVLQQQNIGREDAKALFIPPSYVEYSRIFGRMLAGRARIPTNAVPIE